MNWLNLKFLFLKNYLTEFVDKKLILMDDKKKKNKKLKICRWVKVPGTFNRKIVLERNFPKFY